MLDPDSSKTFGRTDESDDNLGSPEVSYYSKYYGAYSGADVQVVVHYPFNQIADAELRAERQEQIIELEEQNQWYLDNISDLTPAQVSEHNLKVQVIIDKIGQYDSIIFSQRNAPPIKTLGEIQSFSWSVFRGKEAARFFGSVYPRGYTRGPRTIAGSMVFTIFHEHVLHELMNLNLRQYNTGTSDYDRHTYSSMVLDQLPPLDITLIFANEYGAVSNMAFYGIEFFQEGGTFSIHDIYSENVVQYVARDFDPMYAVGKRQVDGKGVTNAWSTTASNMLRENTDYLKRRNPFI